MIKTAKLHAQAKQNEAGIHSLLPISRRISSCILEGKASANAMITWEEKCHNPAHSHFFFLFPSICFWAQRNMVWDIPMVSWSQLSQLVSCLQLPQWEKTKILWLLYKHCLTTVKHQCVINAVLVTSSRHSTVLAAMKEINSIADRLSTHLKIWLLVSKSSQFIYLNLIPHQVFQSTVTEVFWPRIAIAAAIVFKHPFIS